MERKTNCIADRRTATRDRATAGLVLVRAAAIVAVATTTASAAVNTWNGAGVGAGTATAWDNIANYSPATSFASTNDLDFSSINTLSSTTLNATTAGTVAVQKLVFGTVTSTNTTPFVVTINGNGTAGQTVLSLASSITLPSPSASKVILGSDLNLNLTSASHQVNFVSNASITAAPVALPVLVIASKVVGGGAGSTLQNVFSSVGPSNSAVPAVVLANSGNTVDTNITVGGLFSYTSINNSGAAAGASSFGTSNATSGTINLGNGANLAYIGSGNQSTNRAFTYGGASAFANYASTPSNLTLTGAYTTTSTGATTANFGVSAGNTITLQSAIGNSTGAGFLPTSLVKKTSSAYYTADGTLSSADGNGTLVLTGVNTYTGTTTVSAGTLQVGNGTSGSLNGSTGTALTFNTAGGTFHVNEAGGASQGMGVLTFAGGHGVVKSTNNGGNSSITFTSLAARASGASADFVIANGTNGTTNKIAIAAQSAGLINQGVYFGGNSFAWYDAGGFVRGINYGSDAGTVSTAGAPSVGSVANLQATGNITAQATGQTFTTLHLSGTPNFVLASGATATIASVLKSGGGNSIISGSGSGVGIRGVSGTDLIFRADQASDTVTVSTPILANGTTHLVKSGAGKLVLNSAAAFSGNMYLNGGTIQVTDVNAIPGGFTIVLADGKFQYSVPGTKTTNRGVLMTGPGTIQADAGSTLRFSTTANISLGVHNLTIAGDGNIDFGTQASEGIVTSSGGGIIKEGSGVLTLRSASTYVGATRINAGSLVVGVGGVGSLGTSSVFVNADAKLAGSGTVGGAVVVNAGGQLSPGNSIGTLTVGSLDVSSIVDTGGLQFELGSTGIGDKVTTSGVVSLGTLNFADFSFVPTAPLVAGSVYTLMHGASLTGSIGTAAGSLGTGFSGTLSITGGTDVILTVAVPEPAVLGVLSLAGMGLLGRRRGRIVRECASA